MAFINLSILTYISYFILSLSTLLYVFIKYSHGYWAKRGVPFIKPSIFFGSMKNTILQKLTLGEEALNWYNEYKAKGCRYIGLYFFHQAIFMPIDREIVKNMLGKDFDHFFNRGTYCNEEDDPLSAHLFALEGMKWKQLRQKLTPTFTSGRLRKMFQTLVDCTEELKDCLDSSVEKSEAIDIKRVLVQYTTDVIGSCAFGIECNSFKNPDSDFLKTGERIFAPPTFERMKQFVAFLNPSLAKKLKMRIINQKVDAFFRNLVKETVEYRENNNVTRNDFMQLLIQLKNKGVVDESETTEESSNTKLSINEVAAQAFLFFLAGFETSSTTMTFCLYELAKNPEIQERARQDIVNTLKKHDGKLTYDSVMSMHYMERVIQGNFFYKVTYYIYGKYLIISFNYVRRNTYLKNRWFSAWSSIIIYSKLLFNCEKLSN